MKVEVLYFKGCPNHLPTVERVRETLHGMGLHEEIREIEVDTQDKAEAAAFLGSPSVRINGEDVEPSARGVSSPWRNDSECASEDEVFGKEKWVQSGGQPGE